MPQLSRPAEEALWAIARLDTASRHPELAVLRTPAIVENYVDTLLDMLAADYLTGDSDFQSALEHVARERLHQNWTSRREWLRDGFKIAIDGQAEDQDFTLLVQLRNALSHGAEGLTGVQRRKLSEQLALERDLRTRLEVSVDGHRIRVTHGTAVAAVRVGNRYVRALDAVAAPILASRALA